MLIGVFTGITYINQDFVLNYMKTTPDHALKSLILTGIDGGYSTLPSLREYVKNTPYVHNGEEYYYRLSDLDFSGNITYHKTIKAAQEEQLL